MADIALEYRGYCDSDAEQVTAVLADVFSRHDPLAYAAHVTHEEFAGFVRSLLPQAGNDGLTIVACVPRTGEVVGVMLTNDGAADSAEELAELNQKFRPIASILGELDEIYLAGRKPAPGEMLHLYLLGVSDRVAGQGIGQQLVLRTVEHGASKGYRIAFAESTNRRSQHIFKKLGFAERAQILYGEHVFEGQNFFAVVAKHGGPILMEKMLAGA
ncbi:MAG TPA: GNAT family N-acetyltransferase [Terracidiphilus sp.]|nr:GNAT family N-acetyltransferase [Terracidiphilus sp.]